MFLRRRALLALPWRAGPLGEHVDPAPSRILDKREVGGRFLRLSHGVCHFRVDGTEHPGRLVVLVHGMAGSEGYFRYLTAHLTQNMRRRVLRFDNYGRGCTSAPAVPHTRGLFSAQLAELLLALPDDVYGGFQTIDLIGYSLGGGIVASFAAVHGRRLLNSLTMIAPVGAPSMTSNAVWGAVIPVALRIPGLRTYLSNKSLDPGGSEFTDPAGARYQDFSRQFRRRARHEARTLPASFLSSLAWFPFGDLEHAFRAIGNTLPPDTQPPPGAGGGGAATPEPNGAASTAAAESAAGLLDEEFTFPVCVIWGADDGTCPAAGAAEIAQFIPRAAVHVLPGHRHCIAVEHEAVVGDILGAFWSSSNPTL